MVLEIYDDKGVTEPELLDWSGTNNFLTAQLDGNYIKSIHDITYVSAIPLFHHMKRYSPIFKSDQMCRVMSELIFEITTDEDYIFTLDEYIHEIFDYLRPYFEGKVPFDLSSEEFRSFVIHLCKMLLIMTKNGSLGIFIGWYGTNIVYGNMEWFE